MRSLRSSLMCTVMLASTPTALAQVIEPGQEGELANFLPPDPGAKICYARTYSDAHLKAHPKQRVAQIEFNLSYYRHDPNEFHRDGQRNYYFALRARLRGETSWGEAFGECSPKGDTISCGVECDGGGVLAKRRDADKALVYFGDWSYIRMAECDGGDEGDTTELTPGADDKEFLLTKTADADCPAYDDW
jgi:hypothetical protein